MRTRAKAGNILFALAVLGLGIISLATAHFAAVWEPVPKELPARHVLAYANGVLMLLLGAGLLLRWARARAALALLAYLALWLIVLHVRVAMAAPRVANHWSAFGECGTMIAGALLVLADASARDANAGVPFLSGDRGVRVARIVYAIAACLMSLANLAYLRSNADFPPTWIPHWIGWGYLVGIGFIATGVAVLCRTAARLATWTAAWMMSLLTLGCWVSFVIESPGERLNWTGLMISSMLSGAGWLVAETYRGEPWLAYPGRSGRRAGADAAALTPPS